MYLLQFVLNKRHIYHSVLLPPFIHLIPLNSEINDALIGGAKPVSLNSIFSILSTELKNGERHPSKMSPYVTWGMF